MSEAQFYILLFVATQSRFVLKVYPYEGIENARRGQVCNLNLLL